MFTVTASVSYTFDPEDGIVTDADTAHDQVVDILNELHPSAFTIIVTKES